MPGPGLNGQVILGDAGGSDGNRHVHVPVKGNISQGTAVGSHEAIVQARQ
jgi:hypothetical protein